MDHVYAIFLLAQFREKSAFPLLIKFASLPNNLPFDLLGSVFGEDLHNIIASVYDDGLSAIQSLIEIPCCGGWSRSVGMATLLTLVKENVLERKLVIDYFKSLFYQKSIATDQLALSELINMCCDLYAVELYSEIENAFASGIPDPSSVDIERVTQLFEKNLPLECGLLSDADDRYGGQYGFIDDIIDIMSKYYCGQFPGF